ncbi:MAG: hypothetical protein HOQ24_03310 [Mycobacteriaceae bacterium]|nr:hypothetical protein [Mycobacteriaceae bacterium]
MVSDGFLHGAVDVVARRRAEPDGSCASEHRPGSRMLTAIQWGAPAFVLAGTFLMAARPMNFVGAFAPVLVAAAALHHGFVAQ